MRSLVLAFCGLVWALSANAQPVEVRSGQHDGFIRLIVDLPERVAVNIENWHEEAHVTFPGQELTFDTSRIFRRISRDQVADVTSGKELTDLRIKLDCQCEVTSFWHGKSLLVLDVRETATVFPSVVAAQGPRLNEVADAIAAQKKSDATATQRVTFPQGGSSHAASLAKSRLRMGPDSESDAAEATQSAAGSPEEAEISLDPETRDHLARQLGRAVNQGLISPRPSITARSEAAPATEPPEEKPSDSSGAPQPAEHLHLHAQSSIDRDFLAIIEAGAKGISAQSCISEDALDLVSWGSDKPFAHQVGELRKELTGEFDRLNVEAVIRLARLYLFFGFDVEARQTLALVDEESDAIVALSELAEVMENGHAQPGSKLSSQLHCEGPAALWSILALETLPPDAQINKDAALRVFDALPKHLRSHLGPHFSRRLLDYGDQASADKVLQILNRTEETRTAGAQLVEAEIDLVEGENAQATETMAAVVETNSEPSAQALIGLIDTKIRSQEAVSFDHAVLAGAYLQQNRGSELEGELARVYLTGLAASGAFEQSYEERERLDPALSLKLKGIVDSEMLNQLTKLADDITFLEHVFEDHATDHARIDPKIANTTAARLLEIGFAEVARPFVARHLAGKPGRERMMLRARIAIMEGRPHQVEAELLSVEGADADLLRAKARSMVGDHLAAADFFVATGDTEQSRRQAWLAEDWNRLLEAEDPALSSSAALALLGDGDPRDSDSETTQLSDRILSRNRGLIQQSSAARETIQQVLEAHPLPGSE
ncbi:hypothetical protein AAFO92_01035 [Roseovarius sp. CAU 1744]|uniref:hypothetical protein n=1 Tax=Roseovarius sp. CAU 1744 TaxID=3140368 RepID=UPI00325B6841